MLVPALARRCDQRPAVCSFPALDFSGHRDDNLVSLRADSGAIWAGLVVAVIRVVEARRVRSSNGSNPDTAFGPKRWTPRCSRSRGVERGKESERHVRTVYRSRPACGRAGPRRGPHAQPQLHRYRAHPARPDPRGRGRGRQGDGVARHLPRGGPPAGGGDHRSGPAGPVRSHPVHPAGQEGARAVAARSAAARPQLHRHRAHPARPDPRGRRRRRPGAGQARRRPQPGPPAGHPAAQRLPVQGAGRRHRRRGCARRPRWCSTSSAAT